MSKKDDNQDQPPYTYGGSKIHGFTNFPNRDQPKPPERSHMPFEECLKQPDVISLVHEILKWRGWADPIYKDHPFSRASAEKVIELGELLCEKYGCDVIEYL